MRKVFFCVVVLLLPAAAGCGKGDGDAYDDSRRRSTYDTDRSDLDKPREADNTGVNVRDKDGNTVTPMDQGGDESDRKITADIRKRVMDAKLSVDAQNAKIVTQGGRVTLRGPVSTQAEKDTIARIAGEVAGAANVDNQLEIAVVAR